jgi:CheY-like chemotaxis protein
LVHGLLSISPVGRGGFFSVDSLRGVYVLVVTRESPSSRLLGKVLEYCGALVTMVESAKDAIKVIEHLCPNAVVLGPSDEPVALVRKVREQCHRLGRPVSIVAVGADPNDPVVPPSMFDGYLAEPLDPWDLCRLVAGLTQTR